MVAGRTLKLRVPALIATWLSAFVDYRPYLDPGERGVVQVLAADPDQAKIILRYTKAFFFKVPMLSRMVERETQFGLELSTACDRGHDCIVQISPRPHDGCCARGCGPP